MSLVTIDVGNTTVDCLAHGGGTRACWDSGAPDAAALLRFVRDAGATRCVVASVVPGALARVLAALSTAGVVVQQAGVELPCPLPMRYTTPQTLGVDRWLGALAAHRRSGRAVTVDCGTATTVNLVEADGSFCGGPIGPGLEALIVGMVQRTPALPRAVVGATLVWPPDTSQRAVDAGVLAGYCGLVERLVADTLRAARGPADVWITGGRAEVVLRYGRLRARSAPDLVHEGMRVLAEASPCGC